MNKDWMHTKDDVDDKKKQGGHTTIWDCIQRNKF